MNGLREGQNSEVQLPPPLLLQLRTLHLDKLLRAELHKLLRTLCNTIHNPILNTLPAYDDAGQPILDADGTQKVVETGYLGISSASVLDYETQPVTAVRRKARAVRSGCRPGSNGRSRGTVGADRVGPPTGAPSLPGLPR